MPKLQDVEKKAKADIEAIRAAAKGRVAGYLTAGLGFVAGLAWNEAIISLINEIFPSARNTVLAKFLYAGILTIVVTVAAVYIERILSGEKAKE